MLTDAADYPGLNNLASNPTLVSQYCNGARVPPENGGMGYNVPPGMADATLPNPIFSLTPGATVDEGNNWINMSWGPLSLTNPVTEPLSRELSPRIRFAGNRRNSATVLQPTRLRLRWTSSEIRGRICSNLNRHRRS